ncbi:MAG TPA: zinc-ribbon domain containing protein [Pirellulales bacterium]|nr:zinc-ribbon domain containing protein [Pirellulales bacterium]
MQRLHTKEQEGVAVNAAKLATNNSYCAPDYLQRGYYLDVEFTCQGCGLEQVWTAKQQKWWYEVAKGSPFSTARLCRPCRRKERERRTAARRIHLEGLASKQRGRHDSAQAERRR